MFEPKLVSPLLDGYIIGQPISDHHGVRCCPAMKEETEEKYIVKIISIPASQSKLDALLLAGAFQDEASARDYFQELAQGIVEDAVLLQRLSRLEGFVSYENWQIVPMEEGTGFDVYLLSPYRPTLEKYLQRNPMTHLGAVNLGLDLCSALAACRRSGYVYADLRPGNVYICENQEYRIGDLGFIAQASLSYCSLPDKFHSDYTPPEISDAYSSLNSTLDIYAVGLILYQAYNGGVLPPAGQQPLPPPEYADYEMAEIILKACATDPAARWQDPTQMGQALVNYMQRNGVNDTPIVPPVIPLKPEVPKETPAEDTEEIPAEAEEVAEVSVEDAEETEDPKEESSEEPAEEAAEETEEAIPPILPAQEDTPVSSDEEGEIIWEQLSLEDVDPDSELAMAVEAAVVSEEVSQMLAQADDLIAHETPEGVVAPEPIEIPMPEPIFIPAQAEERGSVEKAEEEPAPEDADAPQEIQEDTEDATGEEIVDSAPVSSESNKSSTWINTLICLLIAAILVTAGWLFYQYYYLQTILAIDMAGNEDRLTVTLTTDVAEELLTVVCADAYGNTLRADVENGVAKFTGLKSNTRYTVTVQISGLHKLIGKTSDVYITAEETSIIGLSAVTGNEAGSVVLSFSSEGPETNQWQVTYYAKGEMEQTVTFSGHVVTIDGLTIGKTYTFLLEPVTDLYVVGTDTVEFTVTKIIYPENLAIQGFRNNAMTVTWDAPEGETVESWEVHCYNNMGYDKTVTVTETTAVFEDLDTTTAYTVEVNVTGMSMISRTGVSANSVTIYNVSVDGSKATGPILTWEYEGNAPSGGWLVLYTIADMGQQLVVKAPEASAALPPLVPGCTYAISIQAAAGNDVFGGELVWAADEAESFSGYLVKAKHIELSMCLTPTKSSWTYKDVKSYTTEFHVGESASFTMYLDNEYSTSSNTITVLFLIRDDAGKIISCGTDSMTWNAMWKNGRGTLTIPTMPETPGKYNVAIYFNGGYVNEQDFTIE